MPQKDANRLGILQERINQYNIRFPVAVLVEGTGYDKGYISAILKGKKPISDNFWSKFNEVYPEKIIGNGHPAPDPTLIGAHVTLQDYINEIKTQRDMFYALLSSNLGSLQEGQRTLIAYQKAWVDQFAEKESKGDPNKKAEIMYRVNKLVDDILSASSLSGTQTGSGKRSRE